MKTKKQENACNKKNWSQISLDKQCNITIDTDDVRVMSADGALFKMNKKTQQGKLLFYYRLPAFPSCKENQNKMLLRAIIEVRMDIQAMTTIADCIKNHYAAIQNQAPLDKFADSKHSDSHIMFG